MREIGYRAITEITTFRVRGQTVMIDRDLAAFYGVPTKILNGAVRRIIDRFPEEFMFRLSPTETRTLKEETDDPGIARLRRNPYAFTEQGIHAISYFLKSPRAIKISVEIIKGFHSLRESVEEQRGLITVVEELKKRQDVESKRLFEAIRSVRRLEAFRDEVTDRVRHNGMAWLSEPARDKLDKLRQELDQIERRAMGHRELVYLVMMVFGALLAALLFFPR